MMEEMNQNPVQSLQKTDKFNSSAVEEIWQDVVKSQELTDGETFLFSLVGANGIPLIFGAVLDITLFVLGANPTWIPFGIFAGGLLGTSGFTVLRVNNRRKLRTVLTNIAHRKSQLEQDFTKWLQRNHQLALKDPDKTSAVVQKIVNEDTKVTFTAHDNKTYMMTRTGNSWALEKVSAPLKENLNASTSVWTGESKTQYETLLAKISVLSSQKLSVEERHVLNRAAQELEEFTDTIEKLHILGQMYPEDEKEITQSLQHIDQELDEITSSSRSALRRKLKTSTSFIEERKAMKTSALSRTQETT